jgi:ABC-2 type transport system ATP-binding protein
MTPRRGPRPAARPTAPCRRCAGVDLEVGRGELFGLLGRTAPASRRWSRSPAGSCARAPGAPRSAARPAGSPAAQRSLGYLAELFRFPDWCTRGRAARLHQRARRLARRRRERRELLELVGLADVPSAASARCRRGCSSGSGSPSALVGSPQLLLLDEPTSALDPAGRRTVRELLEHLREREVGVLLNSHLLSEIELICDRVAIIDHGEVVAAGTPAELTRPGGVRVETDAGTRLFRDAGRDDAPDIVRDLVAGGAQVYDVRVLTSTLEDAYLEAVGEDRPGDEPPAAQAAGVEAGG